ncbi:MAG TPA: hypothetical protein VHD83_18990 [Puia sp.]|nr:hypothetical protein [Puia sp.]
MKRTALLVSFVCMMSAAWSQGQPSVNDSSFRAVYKAAALHPGYSSRNGIVYDSVIRRWDKNIVIYVIGGAGKEKRAILGKLKNTISLLSPSLSKISISFTDEMRSANYLIDLDYKGRSHWYITWDALGNIYKGNIYLNPRQIFNADQQASLVSHYFYQTLGYFVFNRKDRDELLKGDPSIASNIFVWRHDINDLDLRILKLHYSDDIKPGMAEKDVDQYFDKHTN